MKTGKHILNSTLCLFISLSAFAQPSVEQVKAEIKAGSKDIIEIKVGDMDKRLEGGVYKYYVSVSTTSKTPYQGITRVYNTQRRYTGKTFEKSLVGNGYYLGIPNPDIKSFQPFLEEKIDDLMDNDLYEMIGDKYPEISLADKPEIIWENLNSVAFHIQYTYEVMNNVTREVRKIKRTNRVSFSRSIDGVNWDNQATYLPNGKWIFDGSKRLNTRTISKDVISSRTAPEDEKVVYFADMVATKKAQEKLNSLAPITIPDFANSVEAIQFVHQQLFRGNKGEIEAMLYKMADPYYFSMYEERVLNANGNKFFASILEDVDVYSSYFCEYPQVKHSQEGLIQYYTRDLSSFNRIKMYQHKNGTWIINALEFPSSREERLTASKNAGDANCGQPLKVVTVQNYQVGDVVMGNIRGKMYPGKVEKLDDSFDDRYFVRFEGTSAQWITADKLQPGNGSSSSSVSSEEKSTNTTKTDVKNKLNGVKGKIKLP